MIFQEIAQKALPRPIDLLTRRHVTLASGDELKPVRDPKQFVDILSSIEIAPTLEIVRIAARVFRPAASDQQECPRRSQRQQFMMIVLKPRTSYVGIEQALHRSPQLGDGIIRRVNVVK